MKAEYLDFLHDTLKYLGFGENTILNNALDEQIQQGAPSFELETDACFDNETIMSARLYFKRGNEQFIERYFLNKYEAHLRYPDQPEKDLKKMFYIEKNRRGVTFKQAFNLFQGRFVQRKIVDQNGDKHQWWVHLEPKLATTEGDLYLRFIKRQFDLEKAVEKYPIRELGYPDGKERICSSLRRGNLHPVTFLYESGKNETRLLYVNADRGVIGNVSMATGAREKKDGLYQFTDLPEFEHPDGDAISESILEEERVMPHKKVHF
jgi:hypothetical protein